jgi:hypothetical protein
MTARPPRTTASPPGKHAPASALDYEIAQEMASALGRHGRALEAALAALATFDAEHAHAATISRADRVERSKLIGAAGHALWCFIVQREACGLRDARFVLRDYRVPAEVSERMGAFPPAPPGRRHSRS